MTLTESAMNAVLPWNSLDAESAKFEALPQQEIEICLNCKYHADRCETCSEWNARRIGRPKSNVDTALLKEMLRLRRCNSEMCAALGISRRTLQKAKKQIMEENL